jgi:hypothetical protein
MKGRQWRNVCCRLALQAIWQERAALIMQTAWRGAVVRREYLSALTFWRATVRIQAAWRGYAARQLYIQVGGLGGWISTEGSFGI